MSVQIQAGTTYVWANVKAEGIAADLSGGDNKSVIGFGEHNGQNQQWKLEDAGDGKFFIQNGSGAYLGIEGDAADGVPVICSGDQKQWEIRADERHSEYHRIFWPGTEFNLDLSNHGDSTPGTKVQLWSKTPGKGQLWNFKTL